MTGLAAIRRLTMEQVAIGLMAALLLSQVALWARLGELSDQIAAMNGQIATITGQIDTLSEQVGRLLH